MKPIMRRIGMPAMARGLEVGQRGILVSLPRWGVTAVNPRIATVYQMNFSANCICLEDVVVGLVNRPAMLFVVPSGFKTLRFALLGGL